MLGEATEVYIFLRSHKKKLLNQVGWWEKGKQKKYKSTACKKQIGQVISPNDTSKCLEY